MVRNRDHTQNINWLTHCTGNVHVVFLCPRQKRDLGEQLIQDIQRRALRMEGTITGEHGIGLPLRDMLIEEIGNSGVDMTRGV
jgi:D-lactate dehydrogenase (cytochrome)